MYNYTFKRDVRLITSADYDQVFKHNKVRASADGVIILALRNNLDHARLGLVVPKKVLKRAVWRNRVKRVVRETFRYSQHDLSNIDLVFIAKKEIGSISNEQLSITLKRLWKKISQRLDNQLS